VSERLSYDALWDALTQHNQSGEPFLIRTGDRTLAGVLAYAMSASGQKQTFGSALGMSALPPKADIVAGEER